MIRHLISVGLLTLPGCGGEVTPEGPSRPNIVMIVGDDHGYPDYGFMGSEIAQTPHLDQLAREGTVFSLGYVTGSICRPSLRSLLTGLHPYQWGHKLVHLRSEGLDSGYGRMIQHFETLPRLLAENGYAAFQAGKFWEASYALAGFTHGTKAGDSLSQYPGAEAQGGEAGLEIGRSTNAPVFDFIDAHADRPFFLWYAPMLPHKPFDAPERFQRIYDRFDLGSSTRGYYANITWLDDAVGALMSFLEERGLRQKTLVVYLSDNGWHQDEEHGRSPIGGPRGKGSMYELGFRTPIVFSWPGHIPEGRFDANLVSTVDLFPTLLDYGGARQVEDRPGKNLRSLLERRSSDAPREAIIGSDRPLWPRNQDPAPREPSNDDVFFLRDESWHYVSYPDRGADQLFDVVADPGEIRNVAEANPQIVTRFRREIARWRLAMERMVAREAPRVQER